jgi:predicted RNase H-like HicB family nuclease
VRCDGSDASRAGDSSLHAKEYRKGNGDMSRTKLADRMTFKVVYEPDGSGWHARIPAVAGCLTWGRSLSEARRNIREALATCADLFDDPDAIARAADFEEDVRLPGPARKKLTEYTKARRRAETEQRRAQDAAEHAARALVKQAGVSLRDAGELLGLSRERVRQLAE